MRSLARLQLQGTVSTCGAAVVHDRAVVPALAGTLVHPTPCFKSKKCNVLLQQSAFVTPVVPLVYMMVQ
jgi:hypothetical protein